MEEAGWLISSRPTLDVGLGVPYDFTRFQNPRIKPVHDSGLKVVSITYHNPGVMVNPILGTCVTAEALVLD